MENQNITFINVEKVKEVVYSSPKLDRKRSGELTGYASIDKPWQIYYSKEVLESKLPEMTIYDYLCKNAVNNLDRTALNYFDRKITYKELLNNIEQTASSFEQYGIKKGDIVTIAMPTTPESIYMLYGLSKIGAIANLVDPRTSKEGIEQYIEEAKSKYLFIVDVASAKAIDMKKNTSVEKVINVAVTESMSTSAQLKQVKKMIKEEKARLKAEGKTKKLSIEATKNVINNLLNQKKVFGYSQECIQWKKFFESGKKAKLSRENKYKSLYYEKNSPVVIVHTGGTTGMPKGVILSNDNLNSASFQCEQAGYDFQKEHSWLNIMPLFIAYGCGNGLHLPLSCNMETIIIPAFNPNEFDELMIKYKPNHMVGVPTHYDGIIHSEKMQDQDLAYVIAPTVGGDSMNIELEKETNEFLENHNCPYKVVKGYGMTEVSAAVCACTSNETNELGSVGIPFPHSTIAIFDQETGEELPYTLDGEEPKIGEICISGPNTMVEYFENPKETEKILKIHEDGKVWVHSGDLGYMNERGSLFVIGRIKDMIIRHDGFKIYPTYIEEVIMQDPVVEACKVVGVSDDTYSQGELPLAYIVLKTPEEQAQAYTQLLETLGEEKAKELIFADYNTIQERILLNCQNQLQEYAQPVGVKYIEELPKTNIGKIDVKVLKEAANNEKTYKKILN